MCHFLILFFVVLSSTIQYSTDKVLDLPRNREERNNPSMMREVAGLGECLLYSVRDSLEYVVYTHIVPTTAYGSFRTREQRGCCRGTKASQ